MGQCAAFTLPICGDTTNDCWRSGWRCLTTFGARLARTIRPAGKPPSRSAVKDRLEDRIGLIDVSGFLLYARRYANVLASHDSDVLCRTVVAWKLAGTALQHELGILSEWRPGAAVSPLDCSGPFGRSVRPGGAGPFCEQLPTLLSSRRHDGSNQRRRASLGSGSRTHTYVPSKQALSLWPARVPSHQT